MYGQAQAQTRFNLYHFSIVFSPIQKGANIVLPALTSSTISTMATDGLFRLSKSAWNINLIGSRLMWATCFPTSIPGVFLSDDGRGKGDGHLHLGLSGGGKDNGSLLDGAFYLIFLRSYDLTNTWVSRKRSYDHLTESWQTLTQSCSWRANVLESLAPTHVWKFPVIMNILTSWFWCILLELDLNSTGLWSYRSRKWHHCCKAFEKQVKF